MTSYRDYTDEEVERRGEAIYLEKILPTVESRHHGRYAVINIESEDWRVGEDVLSLASELHAAHPDAALYTVRIGYPYAVRIGGRVAQDPDR